MKHGTDDLIVLSTNLKTAMSVQYPQENSVLASLHTVQDKLHSNVKMMIIVDVVDGQGQDLNAAGEPLVSKSVPILPAIPETSTTTFDETGTVISENNVSADQQSNVEKNKAAESVPVAAESVDRVVV